MKVIVDAGVAVKWFIPEEIDTPADRLKEKQYRLLAPEFMKIEVANTLWKKMRKGEISSDDCRLIVRALTSGAVHHVSDGDLFEAAFLLAGRLDHPVYDCLYLALADREDGRAVTADMRLIEKARAGGLERLVLPLADIQALSVSAMSPTGADVRSKIAAKNPSVPLLAGVSRK